MRTPRWIRNPAIILTTALAAACGGDGGGGTGIDTSNLHQPTANATSSTWRDGYGIRECRGGDLDKKGFTVYIQGGASEKAPEGTASLTVQDSVPLQQTAQEQRVSYSCRTDSQGDSKSDSGEIVVPAMGDRAGSITFSGSNNVRAGSSLSTSVSAQDPDGIARIIINHGDSKADTLDASGTSTTKSVNHTYGQAGSFTQVAELLDSRGFTTKNQRVITVDPNTNTYQFRVEDIVTGATLGGKLIVGTDTLNASSGVFTYEGMPGQTCVKPIDGTHTNGRGVIEKQGSALGNYIGWNYFEKDCITIDLASNNQDYVVKTFADNFDFANYKKVKVNNASTAFSALHGGFCPSVIDPTGVADGVLTVDYYFDDAFREPVREENKTTVRNFMNNILESYSARLPYKIIGREVTVKPTDRQALRIIGDSTAINSENGQNWDSNNCIKDMVYFTNPNKSHGADLMADEMMQAMFFEFDDTGGSQGWISGSADGSASQRAIDFVKVSQTFGGIYNFR